MIYSDRGLAPRADELRAWARRARNAGETHVSARATDLEEDALDGALLAKAFGAESLELDLPA